MLSHNQRIIKLSIISIAGTATAIFASTLISKYGIEGALRLLWEGDHLHPDIREAIDELKDIEDTDMANAIQKIDDMEIEIQTAFLNSVDFHSESSLQTNEILNALPPKKLSKLKKMLAGVSYDLDRIASKIDSVRSLGENIVKIEKKRLSNAIVLHMEQIDKYVDMYIGEKL